MKATIISWWCQSCRNDWDGPGIVDQLKTGEKFFVGFCPKNHKCIRCITEARIDPYFRLSEKLRMQRKVLAKDLIQPGQTGFQMLYKKEYDKIEAAREAFETKQIARKKERDEFLRKNSYNANIKAAAQRVIASEERLENA